MGKRGEKMQVGVPASPRRRGGRLSAYEVPGALRAGHCRIAPPTICRALAALTERGRVHRLEAMNTFIAGQGDRHTQASVQSICDDCESVEESVAPDPREELSSVAGKSGVRPARHVIEIHGLCASRGSGQVRA